MIHIDIFLFGIILLFVGIISMIAGAWLRDHKAAEAEKSLRDNLEYQKTIRQEVAVELRKYKGLAETLDQLLTLSVDGFKKYPSDWERGRVSAFRQILLHLRGRI